MIERPRSRAISAETAYLTTSLMESVIRNGTGGKARELGRPVAGKTGTTNELRRITSYNVCYTKLLRTRA